MRLVLVGVGFSIWSCSDDSEQDKLKAAKLAEGCSLNSNCENPLVCTFSRCHKECDEDRDCPGEQRCVKGTTGAVCQLNDEIDCSKSATVCKDKQVCGVDKECRDKCTTEADCTGDQICANSGECASTTPGKDIVDEGGNIQPDNFGGSGGAGGGGGSGGSSGSSGGSAGTSGSSGNDGSAGTSGDAGTGGSAGTAGAGGASGAAGADGGDGGPMCPANLGDCDMNGTCETSLALTTSCGACTTVCDGTHGTVSCDTTTLKCVVGTCAAGYSDCDKDPTNGCEAQLATDGKNCGACGKNCGGGTCTTSKCGAALLLDPPGNPYYTTSDGYLAGDKIFEIVNSGGWTLRTTTLPPPTPPGEGVVVHSIAAGTGVGASTIDATNAYFFTTGAPPTLFKKKLDGTGPTPQVFQAAGLSSFTSIRVTPTAAYFTGNSSATGYALFTGSLTSGLAPTPIAGLTNRGYLYDLQVVATPAANRLFWVEYTLTAPKYRVFTAPLAGGTPVELDGDVGSNTEVHFAADESFVYWNTYLGSGKVRRVPLSNPVAGAVQDVAAPVTSPGGGVVVDDTYAYYRDSGFNFYRAPKDASASPTLIATLTDPRIYTLFAVDSAYVYGIAQYGEVVRISKTP